MCILLYNALEIPPNSTNSQIRKSFFKKAKRICPDRKLNHPDWKAMNEYFAYVIFAYEILKNPETREAYDLNGFKGLKSRGISIPAGFSNLKKNPLMNSRESQTDSSSDDTDEQLPKTKTETSPLSSTSIMKDKLKADAKRWSEYWARQTEEKMRMKHEHECKEAVIRIAVYKKIVKIAWKKEISNERRSQQFYFCSKRRES